MKVSQRKAEIENEFAALQQIFTSGTFSVICWSAALTSRVIENRKRPAAACAVRTTEDVPAVYCGVVHNETRGGLVATHANPLGEKQAAVVSHASAMSCQMNLAGISIGGIEYRKMFLFIGVITSSSPLKISFHVDYLISRREEQRSHAQRLRLGRYLLPG